MKPFNPPIRDWRGQRVWVIGASSGIGAACARQLLAAGARVMLSARRAVVLAEVAAGYPDALLVPLDMTDAAALQDAAAQLRSAWGGVDVVLVVAGTYSEMRADAFDLAEARALIELNVNGVFNALAATLPILLAQGHGHVSLVSSVAGYSGLPKALAYGPGKAAVINLAESLYLDLQGRGIGVSLVNPGFVATPLTAKNDFPMPALIPAEEAARQMLAGIARGDFHIHFPRRFTNWLRLARLLPYRLYFWLVHRATGL